MEDSAPPQPDQVADAPGRRRKGLHVPLPAVLIGLGVVSGPAVAQPFVVRPDYFQVPTGVMTFLPVLANDTIPNVFSLFNTSTPFPGNVVATVGGFNYIPGSTSPGAKSFTYCVAPVPNNCTTVSLLVVGPDVPVPALSAAALAGLSGVLGWLGMRGRRRR